MAMAAQMSNPTVQVSINEHGALLEEKSLKNQTLQSSLVRKEDKASTEQVISSATEVKTPNGGDDKDQSQSKSAKEADGAPTDDSKDEDGSQDKHDSQDRDDPDDSDDSDKHVEELATMMLNEHGEVERSGWFARRRRTAAPARRRRTKPRPRDCKWGPWKEGKCDKTCGVGHKIRIRSKMVKEAHGGTCFGKDEEELLCELADCPPPPTPAPTPAPTLPPQAFASRMSSVSWLVATGLFLVARAGLW